MNRSGKSRMAGARTATADVAGDYDHAGDISVSDWPTMTLRCQFPVR